MNKLQPNELLHALSQLYNFEPTRVELNSHAVNDTYRVDVPGEHLFFRLYSPNAYFGTNDDDFLFELELMAHLFENGLSVPSPIPTSDGRLLASVEVSGNLQYGALFPRAAGAPHRAWWPKIRDNGVVRELGALLATLHNDADRFSCRHSRYEFDLHFLLEKPVKLLHAAMKATDVQMRWEQSKRPRALCNTPLMDSAKEPMSTASSMPMPTLEMSTTMKKLDLH